jgi:hypothetical protein
MRGNCAEIEEYSQKRVGGAKCWPRFARATERQAEPEIRVEASGFRALADREGSAVTRRSKHRSALPLLRSAALCASPNMIAVSGQLEVSASLDALSGICALSFDVDSDPVAANPLFSECARNSTIIPASYPVRDMTCSDVFNYDGEGTSVDVSVSEALATSVPKPSTRWLCFETATLRVLVQYPRRLRGPGRGPPGQARQGPQGRHQIY